MNGSTATAMTAMTVDDYILLIEVGHQVQQELNRRALEASALTIQQASVLARIEQLGGRANISQLAAGLGRASHSVSGMITSLETAELVTRERSTSRDRRQVWVTLSMRGRQRLAAYKRNIDRLVGPLSEGLISPDEAERLIGVLQTITHDGPFAD